jgi:putative transposase
VTKRHKRFIERFASSARLDHPEFEVVIMTKQQYAHFNPSKYNIDVKIAKVRTSSHSKHNINYHIIWIPKYRKKLLYGRVAEVLKDIIAGQCQELGIEMLALEVMPDHIHLFVGATPTHTPFEIVKKLKGNTSRQLRLCFKNLRYLNYKNHYGNGFDNLWARGYYCGSAGHVSQDAVKRYILEQQGKDVFEYSIFGDITGQTKIGDFS